MLLYAWNVILSTFRNKKCIFALTSNMTILFFFFYHNDSSCKTSIILLVGPLTFNLIYIEETWRTKRHWSLQQPSQRPYCTVVRWLISAGKWLAPLSWSMFLQPVWSSPVWWSTGHILCSCLCPAPGLRSVWLTPQTSCEDFDKRQIFYSHIISSV